MTSNDAQYTNELLAEAEKISGELMHETKEFGKRMDAAASEMRSELRQVEEEVEKVVEWLKEDSK